MVVVRRFMIWSFVGKHGEQLHRLLYSAELISLKFNFPKLTNKGVSTIFLLILSSLSEYSGFNKSGSNQAWNFFAGKFDWNIFSDWSVKAFNYGPKICKGIDSSYGHRSVYAGKSPKIPQIFQWPSGKCQEIFRWVLRISEDSRSRPKNFQEFGEDPDPKISFCQNHAVVK